jgi:hypothetical protein
VSESWAAVLEALEAEVEVEVEAPRSAERSGEPGAFIPPAGLGPLPIALLERAERLLGRMAELQEGLEQRRNEVGRELSALNRARTTAEATAARPVPHFLDTTA